MTSSGKKIFGILFGVLFAVAVLSGAFPAAANTAGTDFSPEGDPLTYTVLSENEMTAAVTGGESGLTSITIPSTVTYNGETYKVTEIAKNAFKGYTTITELTFAPESNLTVIREDAFAYTGMDSTTVPATISTLTFPASLELVEDGAFHCIPVEHFALETNSKLAAIPNGFLAADGADGQPGINTECHSLYDYVLKKVVIEFSEPYPYVPKQVAEACACLKSIDLGENNSIGRIGDGAFKNQVHLTDIDFGTSTAELTIGHGAFIAMANNSYFVEQGIDSALNAGIETLTLPANLSEMGNGSFHYARVKNVVFSDNCKLETFGYSFMSIEGEDGMPGYVDDENSSWNKIQVPQTVLYAADCLESVRFGNNNSFTSINSGAFKNQTHLTAIDFGTSDKDLQISYGAFAGAGNNGYLVAQGIDSKLNAGIETLTFPANLKTLSVGAFHYARVKNLVFSDNCRLDKIEHAFMTIDGEDGMPGYGKNDDTANYWGKKIKVHPSVLNAANCLKTVRFGNNNSLTEIESGCFKNQSHLTEIDFGTPVNELKISYGSFVGAGNNGYLVEQGIDSTLNAGIETLTFPANLKDLYAGSFRLASIKNLVFSDNCKLENIDYSLLVIDGADGMPGNVDDRIISQSVYNAADCLETIRFGKNNSLKTISSGSFKNQSHLTLIDFGTPVNELTIEHGTFLGAGDNDYLVELGVDSSQNDGIDTLVLPANLKELGYGTFRYLRAEQIVCEENCILEELRGGEFSNCDRLTMVDLRGSNIGTISDALKENPVLKCVYFPETLYSVIWNGENEKYCPFFGSGEVNELHFSFSDPSNFYFSPGVFQFLNEAGIVYVPDDTTDEAIEHYVSILTNAGLVFGEDNWKIRLESLHLNKSETMIPLSDSETLVLTGSTRQVFWDTDNSKCATVDQDGTVHANYPGHATIMVKTPNGIAVESCKVLVLFNDVTQPADYFFEPVYWAVDRGITSGYTDKNGNLTGEFGPADTCTRAQIVTFLYRAAGSPDVNTSNATKFKDVKKNDYFYKAVAWASNEGITTGYTDKNGKPTGYFGSNDECTRGQIVTFLYRAAGSPSVDTSYAAKFKDVKKSAYYYKAVAWAAQNGITTGYTKTKFAPEDPCTRGQVVTFLYRAQ